MLVWTTVAPADVFAGRVLDGFVAGELLAGLGVEAAFVGVEDRSCGRRCGRGSRARCALVACSTWNDADVAAALDKGDDGRLRCAALRLTCRGGPCAAVTGSGVLALADNRFRRLRRSCLRRRCGPDAAVVLHGLADAVRHEPSGLVGDAEHAVQLVGGHALLARCQQVRRQQPLVERDLATLEHGADRDGELLAAFVALVEAGAVGLALQLLDAVGSALPQCGQYGPCGHAGLQVLAGLVVVGEDRAGECSWLSVSVDPNIGNRTCLSSI